MKFKHFMLLMFSVIFVNYAIKSIRWLVKEVPVYQFIDKQGKTVVYLPVGTWSDDFHHSRARVTKGLKRGFIDKTGKIVVPTQYDEAEPFFEGLSLVKKGEQVGFIDTTGKLVIPLGKEPQRFIYSKDRFFVFRKQGKYGVVHRRLRKMTIPPIYDSIITRYDIPWVKVMKDHQYGLVAGSTGEVMLPLKYNDLFVRKHFTNIHPIKGSFKTYGIFSNYRRKMVVPEHYRVRNSLSDPAILFVVRDDENGYQGVVDSLGNLIAPCKYRNIWKRGKALFLMMAKREGFGFLNKQGQELTSAVFQDIKPFSAGFAAVKQNNQWGFIDSTGKMVVAPQYAETFERINAIGVVQTKQSKNIIIDLAQKGRQVLSFEKGFTLLSEHLIGFQKEGHWGIMDTSGKVLINPQLDQVEPLEDKFHTGWVLYQKQGKWGFINPAGKMITKAVYDKYPDRLRFITPHLIQTIVKTKEDVRSGLITAEGKIIIPPKFDVHISISAVNSSQFLILESPFSIDDAPDVAIVVDDQGKMIVPESEGYEDIDDVKEGMAVVKKGGLYGYIDARGKLTIPPQYEYASDFSEGLALVRIYKARWKTFF